MPPWENEITPPTPGRVSDHIAMGYHYDTDIAVPAPIVDLTVGAPSHQANIGQAGEFDWYRFVSPVASTYTLETQGPSDIWMSLYGSGSQNESALVTEDDDSGEGSNSRIVSNLSAGTYFIRIRHYQATGTGNYNLSVNRNAQPQPGPAEIVVNGPEVQGSIAAANESDVYLFNASQTATYTITTGSTDTFLTLNGPDNQNAFISQDDDSGPGSNSQIIRVLIPGIYYVRIRHYSSTGTGNYGISVRRT